MVTLGAHGHPWSLVVWVVSLVLPGSGGVLGGGGDIGGALGRLGGGCSVQRKGSSPCWTGQCCALDFLRGWRELTRQDGRSPRMSAVCLYKRLLSCRKTHRRYSSPSHQCQVPSSVVSSTPTVGPPAPPPIFRALSSALMGTVPMKR